MARTARTTDQAKLRRVLEAIPAFLLEAASLSSRSRRRALHKSLDWLKDPAANPSRSQLDFLWEALHQLPLGEAGQKLVAALADYLIR